MAGAETVSLRDMDADTLRELLHRSLSQAAKRDAQLATMKEEHVALELRYKRLWTTYERLKEELALARHRLVVAKAERVDTTQLQMEFEELSTKLDDLAGTLGEVEVTKDATEDALEDGTQQEEKKRKPKGRRGPMDFASLPKETIRITDPVMEALVLTGEAKVMGHESTSQLGYERGGYRHVVTERVKYVTTNAHGLAELETAAVPEQLLTRCLATPSTLAHIATDKFCDGMPLYRQEEKMARDDVHVSRGSMSRWMESLGGVFGATIVHAMDQDARENAFCILTDATGFAIQPLRPEKESGKKPKSKRQACRKGHYFVRIADHRHVLFDYSARHTSRAVWGLFKGFDGYIQADASSVYDVLFRRGGDRNAGDPDDDGCARIEVGCWSHARRKYWEAAHGKCAVARAALLRIGKIFKLDAEIRAKKPPPSKIKQLRDHHLRPLVDEFFVFVRAEYEKVRNERGTLCSALGYSVRHETAFRTFLQDGRLRIDNNPSEGQLRKLVRVRDSALFAGSDEHAESAAGILTLIASAKLHRLHPERYLRDMIRVLPFWPRGRYLELAPCYWRATRAMLDETQLRAEVGHIDIPTAPAVSPPS